MKWLEVVVDSVKKWQQKWFLSASSSWDYPLTRWKQAVHGGGGFTNFSFHFNVSVLHGALSAALAAAVRSGFCIVAQLLEGHLLSAAGDYRCA